MADDRSRSTANRRNDPLLPRADDRNTGNRRNDSHSSAHAPVTVNPRNPEIEDLWHDEQGWVQESSSLGNDTRGLLEAGCLNDPNILPSMLVAGRWLETAEYLDRALNFHRAEAKVAVAYPDATPFSMLSVAHPELYVLPRRQQALELLAQGKREEALKYYKENIYEPTRLARRTEYLDNLISRLDDMVHARAGPLDLPQERRETTRHVLEYMRVYFNRSWRRPDDVVEPSVEMMSSTQFTGMLSSVSPFVEMLRADHYICLVCHQTFTFAADVGNQFVKHLHYNCTALTPAVRRRLPKRNIPQFRVQAAAAQVAAPALDEDDDSQ